MKKKIKVGSKKGTIVCLHGNSSSLIVFHPLFKSKLLDYSIISFDLPGHGDSIEKYKNHSNFSISFFKENLIKCINSIDDDILLVGNSLGGHLAIEISEEIKRLKGLLIFGSPPVKKPINFEEAFLPVAALQTYLTEKPTEEATAEKH